MLRWAGRRAPRGFLDRAPWEFLERGLCFPLTQGAHQGQRLCFVCILTFPKKD